MCKFAVCSSSARDIRNVDAQAEALQPLSLLRSATLGLEQSVDEHADHQASPQHQLAQV